MSYLENLPKPDPHHLVLMEESRTARRRRQQRALRRRRFVLICLALVASLALGGWLASRTGRASRANAQEPGGASATMARSSVSAQAQETPDPTPLFASYKDVGLKVPVPIEHLNDIAFHQASYSYARHLSTTLPTFATDSASKKRGTGRTAAQNVANDQGWLQGAVLRLWRDRPGKPDSAADVGALPGTQVLAPVSGSVLLVKPYKLYGKYDDVQVHIRPEGHDDLDLVMIHVADPQVVAGDVVVGGVTQVGRVRKLSNRMRLQLGDYTTGTGDHVHVQLNQVKPGTTETVAGS